MTNEELLERFETWCLAQFEEDSDVFPDEDWNSLSIGFFAALGADVETCYELATEARYKFQYWC